MLRSYLYVPGNRRDRLEGALTRGADGLIADLEDAVAPSDKAAARRTVSDWVQSLDTPASQAWVRVNPTTLAEDIAAICHAGLAGIVLPKCEEVAVIAEVDVLLSQLEQERDLDSGAVRLSALIESAAGVLNARAIAQAPRIARLQIGEADLAADLGINPGPEALELLWARSQVVAASAAARLPGPIGPVWTAIDDLEGLRDSSVALRNLGFRGRSVIHPKHLPVVHEVFTPSDEEIARARALVELYDAALEHGVGVIRDVDGNMVDEATVRQARNLLDG